MLLVLIYRSPVFCSGPAPRGRLRGDGDRAWIGCGAHRGSASPSTASRPRSSRCSSSARAPTTPCCSSPATARSCAATRTSTRRWRSPLAPRRPRDLRVGPHRLRRPALASRSPRSTAPPGLGPIGAMGIAVALVVDAHPPPRACSRSPAGAAVLALHPPRRRQRRPTRRTAAGGGSGDGVARRPRDASWLVTASRLLVMALGVLNYSDRPDAGQPVPRHGRVRSRARALIAKSFPSGTQRAGRHRRARRPADVAAVAPRGARAPRAWTASPPSTAARDGGPSSRVPRAVDPYSTEAYGVIPRLRRARARRGARRARRRRHPPSSATCASPTESRHQADRAADRARDRLR